MLNKKIMKTNTSQSSAIESGMEKIEEIKAKLSCYGRNKVCKAEVYEMWDGVFEPEE